MMQPLMPKATAVWLIENTTLTFEQVANFCQLHPLEVQSIADGETAPGMIGFDPIQSGQITREEIARCEKDANARLQMAATGAARPEARTKGPRYTPVARRQDKPDAVAWLIKYHPELSDAQISRLIGTTKPTIKAIRDRSHWNASNIKPRDPLGLGLCTRSELEGELMKIRRAAERVQAEAARAERAAERARRRVETASQAPTADMPEPSMEHGAGGATPGETPIVSGVSMDIDPESRDLIPPPHGPDEPAEKT
jgi:hypothetical protein